MNSNFTDDDLYQYLRGKFDPKSQGYQDELAIEKEKADFDRREAAALRDEARAAALSANLQGAVDKLGSIGGKSPESNVSPLLAQSNQARSEASDIYGGIAARQAQRKKSEDQALFAYLQNLEDAKKFDEQKRQFNVSQDTKKSQILPKNTKAQEAVDKQFAKTYEDWIAAGGYADAQENINQLKEVSKKLGKGGNYTGPIAGRTPDFIRSFTNPEALATRDAVQEVAQRSLRQIFGPGFTEKEGAQVISRAYNEKLSEKENKKRVDRLIRKLEEAAKAKQRAAKFYEDEGSLANFKGSLYSQPSQLLQDFEQEEQEAGEGTAIASPKRTFKDGEIKVKDGKSYRYNAATHTFDEVNQ